MVWPPPVRPLRLDMKAPANSIANTAVSSANRPCGIFGLSAHLTSLLFGVTAHDPLTFAAVHGIADLCGSLGLLHSGTPRHEDRSYRCPTLRIELAQRSLKRSDTNCRAGRE